MVDAKSPNRQIANRDACANASVGARLPIGDLATWRSGARRRGASDAPS